MAHRCAWPPHSCRACVVSGRSRPWRPFFMAPSSATNADARAKTLRTPFGVSTCTPLVAKLNTGPKK
eukprot:2546987-Alexandrium_andersonii.AAC.1